MYRDWKGTAAVGLAVLLGCMMPVSTMPTAEAAEPEEPEAVIVAAEAEAAETVEVAEPEEPETVNVAAEPEAPEAVNGNAESAAPEIVITWGGENKALPPGGEIAFEYTNNTGTQFQVSVDQAVSELALFYYFDQAAGLQAKTEEEMRFLSWEPMTPPMNIPLSEDGSYVVYVMAEAGEKTCYARSGGVVVDTQSPVITGVEEGQIYPEGTPFQVEDANLDCVTVNEQPVSPENGDYKVAANGTNCLIRAKDKAGNERTCSISVTAGDKPDTPDTPDKPDEPDKPDTPDTPEIPETDTVISESKTYELKAGVKYHLADGKWELKGDKSVYRGGCDFYVTADGSYDFRNSLAE